MRRILKIIVAILLIVVGGAFAAFYLTPSATLAGIASDRVREATGRELVIEGPIERALFPNLSISLGQVRLSNADWAGDEDMISAESAAVSLRLTPLFGGGVEIENLALVKPVVNLRRNADGAANWEFGAREGSTGAPGGGQSAPRAEDPLALIIENASITDGVFTYEDALSGQNLQMEQITLTASLPALDRAFEITGSAMVNDERAELSGIIDNLAALQAGQTTRADLKLGGDGVSLSFNGSIEGAGSDASELSARGDFSAALEGDLEKTAWIREAAGAALKDVGAASVAGAFSASRNALDVDVKGDAQFKGAPAQLTLKAVAGEGWTAGRTSADINAALVGAGLDVGYEGAAGLADDGAPRLDGAWRAKIDDVASAAAWLGGAAPTPQSGLSRLQSVDLKGAARLTEAGVAADAGGVVALNDRSVALDARAKSGADWASGGRVFFTAEARSDDLFDFTWDGEAIHLNDPAKTEITGALTFATEALRALSEWAGAGPIPAPAGSFERTVLKTKIGVAPNFFTAQEFDVTIDRAQVTGEVTVNTDPEGQRQPRLRARISSDELDLRPFTQMRDTAASGGGTAGAGGSGGPAARPVGWSKEPIDLAALKLVNAEIAIETKGLKTEIVQLGRSNVKITLADGLLTTDLREVGLYGGTAQGQIVLDGRADPQLDVDIDAAGVSILPLFTNLAQFEWLEGTGAVDIDVQAAGGSMDAMMRSLAGAASMKFTDGAIVGFNLAALVRNYTSLGSAREDAPQKTDFAEMSASFALAGGVANTQDFRMVGPLVRLTGAGSIDIGAQTLNMRVEPKAVASLQGQGGNETLRGLVFPLKITGPWRDPSILPDITSPTLKNVIAIFSDGEGSASFLKAIEGDGLTDALGDDATKAITDALGGDGDDTGAAVQGAIDALTGGDENGGSSATDALKGLFGN